MALSARGLVAFAGAAVVVGWLMSPSPPSDHERHVERTRKSQAAAQASIEEFARGHAAAPEDGAERVAAYHEGRFRERLTELGLLEPLQTATIVGFSRYEIDRHEQLANVSLESAAGIEQIYWPYAKGGRFPDIYAEPWTTEQHGNGQGLLFVMQGDPPRMALMVPMKREGGLDVSAEQVLEYYLEVRPAASVLFSLPWDVVGSIAPRP